MKRIMLAAVCCVLMLGACSSRGPAAKGEDAIYRIEVTNTFTHPMTVSVNLGANEMAVLGELQAGETRTFEIRDPSTNDIRLLATDASKSHTLDKHVELSRREMAKVTLK